MIQLLQYLLPFIVAVALAGNRDVPDIMREPCQTCISADTPEFCPPRHSNFANTLRVQTTARRTCSIPRSNLEFIKDGKVINSGFRYCTILNSLITHSCRIEPASRLLYLGRLII